jgi:protein-tyrosine phosphatase
MSTAPDETGYRPGGEAPGAPVPATSVHNLRDIGGWPTTGGGTIRRGLIYRAAALDRLDPDEPAVAALGIEAVYDLRTDHERDEQPDRLPHGAGSVVADVLADAENVSPARLFALLEDPPAATAILGDGRAAPYFEHAYRMFVHLPSARAAYRRLFRDIAAHPGRRTLFHCTTGKDRTGWATATLGLLLGVSEAVVTEEYLLTNEQLLPALGPMLDEFVARGGGPDVLGPVLGVQASYLAAAIDEMRTRHGSVERYVVEGLGLERDEVARLRADLIDI